MYNIERKAAIISLLEQFGEVGVTQLAERFAISKETIRRDLTELEKQGVLIRTHGGALSTHKKNSPLVEYAVSVRGIQRFHEKNGICRRAAQLVSNHDTIFVDNSSTCLYLAQYLPPDISLTVITNSIQFLVEASKAGLPNVRYICLGGMFKSSNMSVYGNIALQNAQEYYPHKAFISCAGIREDGLITDGSSQEADTKKLMLEHAQEVYMLADYTKFHSLGPVFLSRLKEKDTIVTDAAARKSDWETMEKMGVRIIVAQE